MRLIKNPKRGSKETVLSTEGGFACSFAHRRGDDGLREKTNRVRAVKIHFFADDRYFRYVAEMSREDAIKLRDNLNRWLAESD